MSNPYTGSVAAALRKASLLADLPPEGNLQAQALMEARLLELWRAYQAFLAELAFQLQLGGEPGSPGALAQMALSQNKGCGEATELQALLEEPGSWLSSLEAAWQSLWQFSADRGGQSKNAASPALIPARDVGRRSVEALSAEQLEQWQSALTELIHRQRAHSAEW
ncbi:hypothetical protein AWR36_004430 [Microbulbifer flavimaris]|uniref:PasA protein n=1 Tax=Microbulbifer flavimaris TaxID=1781068 RepID=A0ABX4I3J3_9GAMM|nr:MULTISPECIES: DUF6586 family protein [Microbulbifer]KUJ84889.1 hypothetical protein AVO43_04430 [Microbulbifer sp. ZGT114]PCO06987.1 hypothetical protein AWR36_004430 [Microbulbifer flavimaris]